MTTDDALLVSRAMQTPIGELTIVAGPEGLRAVLWPEDDGTRIPRSVTDVAAGLATDLGEPPAAHSVADSATDLGEPSAANLVADPATDLGEAPATDSARANRGRQGIASIRSIPAPMRDVSAADDSGPTGHPREAGRAAALLEQSVAQLGEYFDGTRRQFDLELDPRGTPFQLAAWGFLRSIPYATTASYAEQAAALGDPARARAVGAANGRNPLSVVVPCHRVVASSGALGGFAGGIDRKRWLLEHERRTASVTAQ